MKGFRRLRWKLTLFYVAATIAASWFVQIFTLGLLMSLAILPVISPESLASDTREFLSRPEIAAMASQGDIGGLQAAISRQVIVDEDANTLFSLRVAQPEIRIVAAEPNGRIRLSWPAGAFDESKSLASQIGESDWALALSTLRGGSAWHRDLGLESGQRASAVASVPGRLAGDSVCILLLARTPLLLHQIASQTLLASLPGTIRMAIATGLFGSLFGFLTARWITRRLRGISNALAEWSSGRFAARLPDSRNDEIDVLSADLNVMASQLQDLFALRQTVAASEERSRLAHDLHDTVKQNLFAVSMRTGVLRAQLGSGHGGLPTLDVIESILQETQNELGIIIHNLRPPSVSDLAASCRANMLEWQQRTSIRTEFQSDGPVLCKADTHLALSRVLQESLSNVLRHSSATLVRVSLRNARGRIMLDVSDNGLGFEANQPPDGTMGIRGMRDRIVALPAGVFRLVSETGKGTTVHAECLLDPQEPLQ
jgi:NarL family two-component system sensor histidine kinase LiaS